MTLLLGVGGWGGVFKEVVKLSWLVMLSTRGTYVWGEAGCLRTLWLVTLSTRGTSVWGGVGWVGRGV